VEDGGVEAALLAGDKIHDLADDAGSQAQEPSQAQGAAEGRRMEADVSVFLRLEHVGAELLESPAHQIAAREARSERAGAGGDTGSRRRPAPLDGGADLGHHGGDVQGRDIFLGAGCVVDLILIAFVL
jgi:hypothetical protein